MLWERRSSQRIDASRMWRMTSPRSSPRTCGERSKFWQPRQSVRHSQEEVGAERCPNHPPSSPHHPSNHSNAKQMHPDTNIGADFMRGRNTPTDGWSVEFAPPSSCNSCHGEFPIRSGLKDHSCAPIYNTTAMGWDGGASDAESEAASAEGAYGDGGLWRTGSDWANVGGGNYESKDPLGRAPLWRAAAVGNTVPVRKLGTGVNVVDAARLCR